VQRVILKKEDGNVAAVGGQFLLPSGEPTTIKVNKEVILCAGAFHSPAILELSGIGNPELLQKYGIDVIVDNPNVGENLQDHAMCAISFEAADSVKTADAMVRDPSIMPTLLDMYQKDRSGPLGANFHVVAYTPSSLFLHYSPWAQNHPFSKGNVHITSASAKDKPAVDPKYLIHPLDMEMMARNVQFLQ
jgi:choline dehydrogenase-like flavoprotein